MGCEKGEKEEVTEDSHISVSEIGYVSERNCCNGLFTFIAPFLQPNWIRQLALTVQTVFSASLINLDEQITKCCVEELVPGLSV